jgi:hypothetical protein
VNFIPSRPSILQSATLVLALTTMHCSSSSSPTTPSTGTGVASVTLASASLVAGTTTSAVVTLTSAAPAGGTTVALSSSNQGVAAVQASAAIAVGQSSATVSVTAVAAGTAIIAASLNGVTRQSQILTVTTGPAVRVTALTLSAPTVVGGASVTGTVVISSAAPAGGVAIALSSADPVTVPPSVTVPSGATSATFAVSTRAVGGVVPATITANYAGSSAAAALQVTPPTVATARFGVTGPTETDTCTLANNGTTLNCTFNGSTSTAPGTITAWDWTFGVATTVSQTTTSAILSMPAISCALMPPPPLPEGTQWFSMAVSLTVHDNLGNVSDKAFNNNVRLIPKGSCGF